MSDNTKARLMDLGTDALAEALVVLMEMSPEAETLVGRMLATPEETVERIRSAMDEIREIEAYFELDEVAELADELTDIMDDIDVGVTDACMGITLMAEFFELDEIVFEICDDANGDIGDLFAHDALSIFTTFASRCTDKERLAETLFNLTVKDSYGVRTALIDSADDILSHEEIETLIKRFSDLASQQNESENWHLDRCIDSLSDQV